MIRKIVKESRRNVAIGFIILLATFALFAATVSEVNATRGGSCGKEGDNVSWELRGMELHIYGQGEMADYEWNSSSWKYDRPWENETFSLVNVHEGVTSVGNNAFYGCRAVQHVVLPSTLKSIGESAFGYCGTKNNDEDPEERSLLVDIPSGVEYIGESAFAYSGIKNAVIPKGVKKLERTFFGSRIETMDLGVVEEINGYVFYSCKELKQITLPKTLKVIGIEAFAGAGLTEITIPEGVTSIGGTWEDGSPGPAFQECDNLKRIVFPSTLTFISEGEFNMCGNLEEIDFRGTQEQWNQLTAGMDPDSNLIQAMNDPDIKKAYDYTGDLTDITNAKIELSATAFTYNGKVQKPTIKTIGGIVMKEGVDYTVAWSNASSKNAGEYTVTVTGMGDYIGKTSATYSINKAANPLAIKGLAASIKYKKLKKKTQTLAVGKVIKFTKKGQGKLIYKKASVTYTKAKSVKISKKALKKYTKKSAKKITINASTGKITLKKGLKKGTYKLKIKVKAAGNANYKASAWKVATLKIKVK